MNKCAQTSCLLSITFASEIIYFDHKFEDEREFEEDFEFFEKFEVF
jgi:hypothetical protein